MNRVPLTRPSAFAKPSADKSGTLSPKGERDGHRTCYEAMKL